MKDINSEDTIIFLATDPNIINFDILLQYIRDFCIEKQKIDSTDRFNMISFIENGPIYFEDFTYNPDYMINSFKPYAKKIKNINVDGGIMVAITFIIDTFKTVAGKTMRLIVIMDKLTPKMKYQEVLEDLISKVKDFPFFIDFIRFNSDDPKEDARYIKFAKFCNGTCFFVKNLKELYGVLIELSKKKKLKANYKLDQKIELKIPEENVPFFENMAQNLVKAYSDNKIQKCSICGEPKNLYKCPKCGAISHRECLVSWSEFSNIGIINVFRCQNCFNLLKLPYEFVINVLNKKQGKKESEQISINWLNEQDKQLREKDGSQEIIIGKSLISSDEIQNTDEIFDLKNDIDKIEIIICPNCGKLTTSEFKICLDCGKNLK